MLTNRHKKRIYKSMTRTGWSPKGNNRTVDYTINERAGWLAAIQAATVNGRVGIVTAGMDCDCVKYRYEKVVPAPRSVVAWLHEYEHHCSYLDGPESTWFERPEEVQDGLHESRDLALEAFEDGHPWRVYA